MRNKFLVFAIIGVLMLTACKNTGNGELVGVSNGKTFFQADPFGMSYIPMGSFTMGVGDQDPTGANYIQPKTISVAAFFMDQTEITNSEYRQFVNWVRDSIALAILSTNPNFEDVYYYTTNPKTGEDYDYPRLNWNAKIDWNDPEVQEALEGLYVPEQERFFRRKEVDARNLYYSYEWFDLNAAAKKDMFVEDLGNVDPSNPFDTDRGWDSLNNAKPNHGAFASRSQGRRDRSVFIKKERINIYPDTLCWISDFAYSYNEPLAKFYFSHPAYEHYPVVGVNYQQAKAFCAWRTSLRNNYTGGGTTSYNDFRLPTEAEWEWAARGGYEGNPYPWGGPYTINDKGCYLANFKPNRGNYAADGGLTTVIVAHYPPNDFNLFDMSGNVAEWTIDAFDESSYNFSWDLNMSYTYNAKDNDLPAMKRKVVRGGSWKDVYYNIQVTDRSYEYQDTATCYIGFRCVQSYLGRQKYDGNKSSAIY
jgi:formylglycine-generating enzyme